MTPPTSPSAPTSTSTWATDARRSIGTWHAGVLLFEGFEPLDAVGPAEVLWTLPHAGRATDHDGLPDIPDIRVHLVAVSGDPVTSGPGMVVHPTVTYADCPALDVLVVPGGGGAEPAATGRGVTFFRGHEPTLDFVRRQADQGALVTSVCTGTFILAGAGLLAGRRASTHWHARKALVDLMAERGEPFELVEDRVVDDGDLVTSGGVSSGIDLALHVVSRTFGKAYADTVARIIETKTPTTAA